MGVCAFGGDPGWVPLSCEPAIILQGVPFSSACDDLRSANLLLLLLRIQRRGSGDWLHWIGSGQPEQAMHQAILTFWFDELEPADWWKRDNALDELIRQRFGQVHRQAAAGELWDWR